MLKCRKWGRVDIKIIAWYEIYFLLKCKSILLFSCVIILFYTVGRGVNREGFDFKLAMVKKCSTWTLLNMPFKKTLKWVFRPHRYLMPQTPI